VAQLFPQSDGLDLDDLNAVEQKIHSYIAAEIVTYYINLDHHQRASEGEAVIDRMNAIVTEFITAHRIPPHDDLDGMITSLSSAVRFRGPYDDLDFLSYYYQKAKLLGWTESEAMIDTLISMLEAARDNK
jgi:hypothetical protein